MPRNTDKFNYYTVAVPKRSRLQQKVDIDYEEMTIAEGQLILLYATKYIEAMERGIISEIKVIPPPDGKLNITFSVKEDSPIAYALIELAKETNVSTDVIAKRIFFLSVKQGKAVKLASSISESEIQSVVEISEEGGLTSLY